jgi:aspartyl-tRNA(Asn)/glutamyl-tRNA(Gln) amidotransferase subunit A
VQYGYRTSDGADDIVEMYRGTRDEGFGPEVKRRIMLGTYALSAGYYDAYYLKASQVRSLIRRDFDRAFDQFDVLLGPTSPTPAFRLGEKTEDPISMYLSDVCTIPVNLGGLPAMSLPCGFSQTGLPIGLQLVGRPLDEETLLRVAYAYEQTTDFHHRKACPVETINRRRRAVTR